MQSVRTFNWLLHVSFCGGGDEGKRWKDGTEESGSGVDDQICVMCAERQHGSVSQVRMRDERLSDERRQTMIVRGRCRISAS